MTTTETFSSSGMAYSRKRASRCGASPRSKRGDAAEDLAHRVQPDLERGRHAEAPAGPAKRPEQLAAAVLARGQHLAVGGHDVGAQQVVGGEAVLAREEAVAAAEREAGDADGGVRARHRREAERRGGLDHLAPGRARADARGPAVWIDEHRAHRDVSISSVSGDGSASVP